MHIHMNINNLSVLNPLECVAMQASIKCDELMRASGCACERFTKDGPIELQVAQKLVPSFGESVSL